MEYTYTGPTLALHYNDHTNPRVVNNLVRIYPNPFAHTLNVQAKKDMRNPEGPALQYHRQARDGENSVYQYIQYRRIIAAGRYLHVQTV